MTPDEQEARSLRFERQGSVTLRQLRSGTYAMYSLGGHGNPFWIGQEHEIADAYHARPSVEAYRLAPKDPAVNKLGIDLNALEIDL